MKINEIESTLENRQVYGYKRDGNTVTAHRWKVFPLSGNLYLQQPKADEYGQCYAHVAMFFPGVKIGLDVGMLSGWQLDQYSVEDVERRVGFSTVDALAATINTTMQNGRHIKDSFVAFVRQYDVTLANRMQAYKSEWVDRKERERKAAIAERERKEEQERQERERAIADSLEKAEQAIITYGYIVNKELDGKPLFLRLFDKHSVNVPIRSRGWIIDKLSSVTQFNNGSANISWRKIRKNEKASNGFVSAYFELRDHLIAARGSEDTESGDYCTDKELEHLFGKAV